ncbi:hypothetical protein BC831DRAFT_400764 [Entophlyctis helioformis]|nr:hypothetical protein BC831DRAFT_400764 [Entophlyctis helioformis]
MLPSPTGTADGQLGDARLGTPPAADQLPRFFFKRPAQAGPVRLQLARVAIAAFTREFTASILSSDDLDTLWERLCCHATHLKDSDTRRISFKQFTAAKLNLPDKFAQYFKSSLFLHFARDDLGRIDALQFFNFVLRKVSLMQARVDLGAYDGDFDGCLTEPELQAYVHDLMPTLNLRNISASFEKFYLCTCVRKFLFFLDPLRRGKVPIDSILLSPILTELFELRDPDLPRDFEQSNWFSSYSALRVYGMFLNLDTDRNGMISRSELKRYRAESITAPFLDRVFQEYQTYNGEMDYNAFLDFVLAMENLHLPESIAYCFKLLDLSGRGYLDQSILTVFFKEIVAKMERSGLDPIPVDDVVNEIFDMANPADLTTITLRGKYSID